MNKYTEYNLINNIPILYPSSSLADKKLKYNFCPRYDIANEDILLRCFDKNKKLLNSRNGTIYQYIKINIVGSV